jgi:hypothetical protein
MAALVAEFTGEALDEGESKEDTVTEAVDLEAEAAEEVIEEVVIDEEE